MRIFNASPLILILEEINEPDLLEKLFQLDEVLFVPERVNLEVSSQKARANLEKLLKMGNLKICKNCNKDTFNFFQRRFPMLDDGELTVISLAYEYKDKSCFVIIDEERGREVAKKLSLNVRGAFGLILELYNKQIIDKERLCSTCRKIDKSNFHINFKEIGYEWVVK
ncbi:MAG: hypothetical protein Q8N99_08805 [Nanoarchaeota archaeon]|nr:hypothetical protein [Nanoarchaeota archaeon]